VLVVQFKVWAGKTDSFLIQDLYTAGWAVSQPAERA